MWKNKYNGLKMQFNVQSNKKNNKTKQNSESFAINIFFFLVSVAVCVWNI